MTQEFYEYDGKLFKEEHVGIPLCFKCEQPLETSFKYAGHHGYCVAHGWQVYSLEIPRQA